MIGQVESGLTPEQYAAIQNASSDDQIFKVIAHRWNLDFGNAPYNSEPVLSTGSDADAIMINGYLVWVSSSHCKRINLGTGVVDSVAGWSTPTLSPGSALSLSINGSTLYCWAATSTGVQRRSSSDNGLTWGSWSLIHSHATPTIYRAAFTENGTPSASAEFDNGVTKAHARYAFDRITTTSWYVNGSTGWLQYDLGSGVAKVGRRYVIRAGGTSAPTTFSLQASNDGSSWTTLDSRSGVTWGSGMNDYSFANSTAYRYWRLNITANGGFAQTQVIELNIYELSDECTVGVVAGVGADVYYSYRDSTTGTYNIWKNGVSNATENGFALTSKPGGLAIIDFDGAQLFFIEMEIPGRMKEVLDNQTLTTKHVKMGGIVCFFRRFGSMSEHIEVDIIDPLSEYRWLKNPKIHYINGQFYLTVLSSTGTAANPLVAYRVYTSKDAVHWSLGQIINVGDAQGQSSLRLIINGGYTYAVERHAIWRSQSTLFMGDSQVQTDITNYIDSHSLSLSTMASASIRLHDPDQLFLAHSWLNKNNVVVFDHYLGAMVNNAPVYYKAATTQVDSLEYTVELPERMLDINSRDWLSRMTDDFSSEDARILPSWYPGLDTYLDTSNSGTAYGGLSHSETKSGEWETTSGYLILYSREQAVQDGMIFSTFHDDLWNGMIQTKLLMSGSMASYGGVVFRGKKKTDAYIFSYDKTTDKVRFWVHGTVDTVFFQSAALGYGGLLGVGAGIWLRAYFRYGTIYLYTSTNGSTWTLQYTHTLSIIEKHQSGAPYMYPLSDYDPPERGYCGVHGYCLSEAVGSAKASWVAFDQTHIVNLDEMMVVEDSFKAFASLAGIHDFVFSDHYSGSEAGWTASAGTLTVTGSPEEDVAIYGESFYDSGVTYG
jgi:hypothetical protein